MRKLKSIQKILEENPDAYFCISGNLVFPESKVFIQAELLHYFGDNLSEAACKEVDAHESWFEEEPKPNYEVLYGCVDSVTGMVIFLDSPSNKAYM